MTNNLSAFAFKGNISSKTLRQLKNIDNRYLLWGEKSIDKYIQRLLREQPKYILGLGIYTGRDKDKIRIETYCTNKFKNELVDRSRLKKVKINHFLEPLEHSKLADGIGNSHCNLVSWKIMRQIRDKKLRSKYTFLHIPKSMATVIAVREINKMLYNIER